MMGTLPNANIHPAIWYPYSMETFCQPKESSCGRLARWGATKHASHVLRDRSVQPGIPSVRTWHRQRGQKPPLHSNPKLPGSITHHQI